MKNILHKLIPCLMLVIAMGLQFPSFASSHREAPLISNDPLADNCDLYAFRSPNNPNKVTLIATYVPMQLAHGGPNYYSFGENIRYEIHVDNNVSTTGDDITYRFTFHKENQDPSTFFNIRLGAQNLKTTYTMEKSTDGGSTWVTVITNGIVPPPNIGNRSIQGGAGLNSNFSTLFNNAITTASSGETVFCGSVDDPFFVDLGGVFDLGDLPRQGGNTPKDGLRYLNVSAIAIEVDIAQLQKNGMPVSAAANILDPNYVIGVWASASRQQIRTLSATGMPSYTGPWVQVSRLGMPLTNEAVIPIGKKDLWNSITPYQDLAYLDTFKNFFYNPELGLYMDDSLFGGAVPGFGPLRIQRNSLQAFDFGNGKDGLFGLKGSPAVAGTALDDAIFGTLLLPSAGAPRSVDLWPIFHTGVPNLAPYQLATGKSGNPLANGKPFINNFLPNGGDMLRLNMAVPVTPRNSPAFSSEGIIQAAVLGLTDPMYNGSTAIQFIPNMDGFPNGRRLEDDVTRIELQAVAGVALAAIGLWYDDYTAGGPNPVTQDLVDVLTYATGVNANDTSFKSTFPFVQEPWIGTGDGGGLAIAYTPAPCLPSSCTTPQTFTITPGGTFCSAGNGIAIGLSGSEMNVSYQLKKGTMNIGMPMMGTGMALSFGNVMSTGVYSIEATNTVGNCTASMNGMVTVNAMPTITGINVTNVTGISGKVNWDMINGVGWYEIRYKPTASMTWITGTTGAIPTKTLINLMSNTSYDVQVRGFCSASNVGPWSGIFQFMTNNLCSTPGGLFANNITSSAAKLNWITVAGTSYYTIRYKAVSATNWVMSTTMANSKTITNLIPNTAYEFQVRSHCGSSMSAYSASGLFTTGGGMKEVSSAAMLDNPFTLYPNPVQSELNLLLQLEEDGSTECLVYDMQGKRVQQLKWNTEAGAQHLTVDLHHLTTGLYLVEVMHNGKLLDRKRVTKN